LHILLIEDDPMIGASVEQALASEGIQVDWMRSADGAEAAIAESPFDAILLDLSLPRRDGIEVLRSLRAARNDIPVLVITARDTVSDRIRGLDAGADDYLVKPFDFDEMLARLRALVRRSRGRQQLAYRRGDIVVDCERRDARLRDISVALSGKEWAILELLVARPGMIFSRTKLEQHLYGDIVGVDSNVVEVHIHSLRRKLGQELIVNVRGVGYMVAKSE
jgi:DNA-binding response OmpR family regulator